MLHQTDTDIIFPPRIIASLRHLRGTKWQQLIDRLLQHQDRNHPEILAFSLMMIRHNSCLTCHSYSFRAMRGCEMCTQQMVKRFKGSDEDLIKRWEQACTEVRTWLENNASPLPPRPAPSAS